MTTEIAPAELNSHPLRRIPLGQMGRALRATVFSFEMLFILFLFAGRYKNLPLFQALPIDLTALLFALSTLCGAGIIARRRFRVLKSSFQLVLIILPFIAFVIVSTLWAPSHAYVTRKALYIATLALWPLVACALVIGYDRRRLRRLMLALVLFSLWLAVASILARWQGGRRGTITVLGSNYLGAGRTIGLATLVAWAAVLFTQARAVRVAAMLALALFLFALLGLGGRGPLLATALALAIPVFTGIRFTFSGRLYIRRYALLLVLLLALFLLAGLGYLLTGGELPWTLARMAVLDPTKGESTALRVSFIQVALNAWRSQPLIGQGIGSYVMLTDPSALRAYPHNLILEIGAELGIVGLVLFMGPIGLALWNLGPWRALAQDPWRILALMLFVNALANAMVSGDIPDNRLLFAAFGLMTFRKQLPEQATAQAFEPVHPTSDTDSDSRRGAHHLS